MVYVHERHLGNVTSKSRTEKELGIYHAKVNLIYFGLLMLSFY